MGQLEPRSKEAIVRLSSTSSDVQDKLPRGSYWFVLAQSPFDGSTQTAQAIDLPW
jgi:hypothetical protein